MVSRPFGSPTRPTSPGKRKSASRSAEPPLPLFAGEGAGVGAGVRVVGIATTLIRRLRRHPPARAGEGDRDPGFRARVPAVILDPAGMIAQSCTTAEMRGTSSAAPALPARTP